VLAQKCVHEVIVVDDCSTDESFSLAQAFAGDPRVMVCRHDMNRGKGAAVRTGVACVKSPVVIIQDADLEYDPVEYDSLVAPIAKGQADVVYGVRTFASQSAFSFWYVVGNRILTLAANLLFNCYLADIATGFKAIRTDLLLRLGSRVDRFAIDAELTARLLRLGYRIHEVPIGYRARSRKYGKKVTWLDGARALVALVKIRIAPYRALYGEVDRYHARRQDALDRFNQLGELPKEAVLAQAEAAITASQLPVAGEANGHFGFQHPLGRVGQPELSSQSISVGPAT
jgi:glycosyltransferase involved in cell wall biosynthesis